MWFAALIQPKKHFFFTFTYVGNVANIFQESCKNLNPSGIFFVPTQLLRKELYAELFFFQPDLAKKYNHRRELCVITLESRYNTNY